MSHLVCCQKNLAIHVEVNGDGWVDHNEKKGDDGQDQGLWGKDS